MIDTALGQGGFEFPGPWGVSVAPNITSSQDGLADYSDARDRGDDHRGRAAGRIAMLPPMPYGHFARMTPRTISRR